MSIYNLTHARFVYMCVFVCTGAANLLPAVGHDSALWDPSAQQLPSSASSLLSNKTNSSGQSCGFCGHTTSTQFGLFIIDDASECSKGEQGNCYSSSRGHPRSSECLQQFSYCTAWTKVISVRLLPLIIGQISPPTMTLGCEEQFFSIPDKTEIRFGAAA